MVKDREFKANIDYQKNTDREWDMIDEDREIKIDKGIKNKDTNRKRKTDKERES